MKIRHRYKVVAYVVVDAAEEWDDVDVERLVGDAVGDYLERTDHDGDPQVENVDAQLWDEVEA